MDKVAHIHFVKTRNFKLFEKIISEVKTKYKSSLNVNKIQYYLYIIAHGNSIPGGACGTNL